MSFGFGVGDFIAVGTLCWKLYQNIYKVSRDAPEELRGICDELGALSNTIRLLNDDIQDPHSVLKQPGQENRFDLAADIMKSTNDTLQKLQALAEKHELLRTQSIGGSRRQYFKIQWDKIKFAKEWSAITDLRAKLLYHNNQLSLLLQVLNNSSLERLQKEEKRTQKLIEDVHMAVYGAPNIGTQVTTASFLNTKSVEQLTEAFLVNAQSGTRPWATIGVDSWLQAGRWWLIKAQSSLYNAHPGFPANTQAFVDLLKSSWILTNIISMHPQRKLIVSTDPRDHLIDGLARALQVEHDKLAGLSLPEPSWEQLRSADLSIWATAKITALMPIKDGGANSARSSWKTQDGEILLQSFAYQVYPESVSGTECILILEVQSQKRSVTFIAQRFDGQDIIRVPLYSEVDFRVFFKLSDISNPYHRQEPHSEDTITYIDAWTIGKTERKMKYDYETAFRLVDIESRDMISAFSRGLYFLKHNFRHPPIDIRSLEAAAVLSCPIEKAHVFQRFGSLKALSPQESGTPTGQLCTLGSRAMECLRDGSSAELPTSLRPKFSLFDDSNCWPYLIWLSPTAEYAISLARMTDSVQQPNNSKFGCIRSAFAKGCPVFFDEILKFLNVEAQDRLEWTVDNEFNPEGLQFSDFRLLVRAILQSGDRTLFNSFLELACRSWVRETRRDYRLLGDFVPIFPSWENLPYLPALTRHRVIGDFPLNLGDILLEAAIRLDKTIFENAITNPMVIEVMPEDDCRVVIFLDTLLSKGLQEFPVQGLEWLLDLLPGDCLVDAVRSFLKRAGSRGGAVYKYSLHVFVFGDTTARHRHPQTLLGKQENELWIIPALLRQDRKIVGLFLDRGLGRLHSMRYTSQNNWSGPPWSIPPRDMPDLPLYCAIFLAFDPEFILFLCERGASVSGSATSEQPEPAIIQNLVSLLTIHQARKSFKDAGMLIHNMFNAEALHWGESDLGAGSVALCLRIAKDVARKHCLWFAEIGGFYAKSDAKSDTESDAQSVEARMPFPLQSQENWDQWRTEVLQILRGSYAKSRGV